ncbi:hypothetical protein BWD11_03185 [Leptospira santarosai serovar Grippotyphosa]|nr:hypothetical protein BWD11_03185 [Leptospira santarosai serovar Grippotyphosa]
MTTYYIMKNAFYRGSLILSSSKTGKNEGVPTNYVSLYSFYDFEQFFSENFRKSSHMRRF